MELFNSVCDVKIMHYSTSKEIWNSQAVSPKFTKQMMADNLLSQLLKPNIFLFLPFLFCVFFFFFPSSFPASFLPFLLSNEYLLLVGEVVLSSHYFYLVRAALMVAQQIFDTATAVNPDFVE